MENNFKYIVYQTINIVNNKIYVGVHKTKNPDIFDGYIGNGVNINYPSTYINPKYPFQYAVKKYGTSNFKRSILFIFSDEKEAYTKELEIVNKEFVLRKDTYNCILGGSLRPLEYIRKKIYQFDTNGKLIKEWIDAYEISNYFNIWKNSVYQSIRTKNRLCNFYWSFQKIIDISEYSSPNLSQKVYKYNKFGKCICIYNSINEAAKINNYRPCELFNRIKEQACTRNNYYSLTLYDEFIPKPRLCLKNKIIYVYNINGKFEQAVNYKDIHAYLKLNSNKRISTAIKTQSLIGNKQLRLTYEPKISAYIKTNNFKPVVVYTTDGKFIGEFRSINYACKILKLDNSSVNKVLRGISHSTKGYTIKLKN